MPHYSGIHGRIMEFQTIFILNLFGIVLLLFLIASRFATRQRRRLGDKFFTALTLITMGASIVEIFSFWIDGKPGVISYWLNLLCNTGLYMANVTGCFVWLLYVDLKLYRDRKRLLKKIPVYAALPGISAIALIVNIFKPFLLYIDSENIYHRLPLCNVLYFFVMLTGAESIVIYFIYRKKHGRLRFFPIWMFMLPVVAGCLGQAFFYGISTAWPGTCIGIVAIYMGIQNEKSYIDPLTGLYNRQFLEHTLLVFSETRSFYGIMFDLNKFKDINDRFGHSTGDRALFRAGRILHRASESKGTVFRFAGDEFIILMNSDSEADVLELKERVWILSNSFNTESGEPFRISFSMGYAKYSKGESQDDFLHRMDQEMYIDKKRMHKLLAKEEFAEGAAT